MEVKNKIVEYILNNPSLAGEYKEEDDKWLFVEYNILDMLGLRATTRNVECAETMLEMIA